MPQEVADYLTAYLSLSFVCSFKKYRKESLSFLWDPENAYRLCVFTHTGVIHWLEFVWNYQVGVSGGHYAAVIDGKNVQMTPLAKVLLY